MNDIFEWTHFFLARPTINFILPLYFMDQLPILIRVTSISTSAQSYLTTELLQIVVERKPG
jgi:hypothetical protein